MFVPVVKCVKIAEYQDDGGSSMIQAAIKEVTDDHKLHKLVAFDQVINISGDSTQRWKQVILSFIFES